MAYSPDPVFDPLATGAQRSLWVGEAGLLTMVATVIAALLYARRAMSLADTPATSVQVPVAHVNSQVQ